MQDESPDSQPAAVSPLQLTLRKLFFKLGVLVVAGFLVMVVAPPFLFPRNANVAPSSSMDSSNNTPTQDDPRIATLTSRMEQLEAKLKVLEESLATGSDKPSSPPTTTTLNTEPAPESADRLHRLEESLAAQEASLAAIRAQFETTQTRSTNELAAMAAFSHIKEAITHGDSFAAPLATLHHVFDGHSEKLVLLEPLASYAQKGAITLSSLQSEFQILIPSALSVHDTAHSFTGSLASLIRIRKVGAAQTGLDDEAIIARAEVKLSAGDIRECLQEISALSKPAGDILSPWIDAAKNYLVVSDALHALELALLDNTPAAKRQ